MENKFLGNWSIELSYDVERFGKFLPVWVELSFNDLIVFAALIVDCQIRDTHYIDV